MLYLRRIIEGTARAVFGSLLMPNDVALSIRMNPASSTIMKVELIKRQNQDTQRVVSSPWIYRQIPIFSPGLLFSSSQIPRFNIRQGAVGIRPDIVGHDPEFHTASLTGRSSKRHGPLVLCLTGGKA